MQCFSFLPMKCYTAFSDEIFEPAGHFPTSYLAVVWFTALQALFVLYPIPVPLLQLWMGLRWDPPSSPSMFLRNVWALSYSCGQLALQYWKLLRSVGSHNATWHHNNSPAGLGFAFSFSQFVLKATDPNFAHACCIYLTSHLSLVIPHWPLHLQLFFSLCLPFFSLFQSFFRCFETGHYLYYQKFPCGELYFKHWATPSALLRVRPGVAFSVGRHESH